MPVKVGDGIWNLGSLWSNMTFLKLQTFKKRFKLLPSSTSKFFMKAIFCAS